MCVCHMLLKDLLTYLTLGAELMMEVGLVQYRLAHSRPTRLPVTSNCEEYAKWVILESIETACM